MLSNIITISLGAILINNFIFSQFLGICPFLGCSNKVDTATGMGLAVVFVMGNAANPFKNFLLGTVLNRQSDEDQSQFILDGDFLIIINFIFNSI